jgi:hypothetical protein
MGNPDPWFHIYTAAVKGGWGFAVHPSDDGPESRKGTTRKVNGADGTYLGSVLVRPKIADLAALSGGWGAPTTEAA